MKHTLKPWIISREHANGINIEGRGTLIRLVATVRNRSTTQEETEANARLIAAAPELLEFVKDVATGKHGFGGETHRAVSLLNKLGFWAAIKATK